MAYNWKIVKAAVEQIILFPSEQVFETYCCKLTCKQEPFEIKGKKINPDGTVTAIFRKRYNQNDFLSLSDNI